jgi:ankyrin repeat protein
MQRGDSFQLSTNIAAAGNFDDLVYATSSRRYFLQLKHTENPNTTKLVHSDLVPLLHQCFESFYEIVQGTTFNDIPIHNSEFIIYTNKQLGPKLLQHNRKQAVIDMIFKTCDKGDIFSFTEDNNTAVDVYTRVEQSVKKSKEFNNLTVPEQNVKIEMVSKFLKKLVLITGQKGQSDLDDVISEEIRKYDTIKTSRKMYKTVLHYFKTRLEAWWRNRSENMTAEMLRNWLQEAKTKCCSSVVRSLFKIYKKKLVRIGIKFSDREILRLRAELCNRRAVHLRTDACMLCSVLLADCLPVSKCIFVNFKSLLSNTDELLHAWAGGVWEWLVVDCDSRIRQSHISKKCLEIADIIKHIAVNKGIIILTQCSVKQLKDFVPIEHKFKFEQLEKESQEMVFDKKIDFQGCKVSVGSVLQRHGDMERVLGAEIVTDLIKEENYFNIGESLHINMDYYAPRVLERKVYLHLNVLCNPGSHPDIFAVSQMKERDLIEHAPSGEIVGTFYWNKQYGKTTWEGTYDGFESSRFIRLSSTDLETCFLKLCEKYSGRTLHWVEFNNGKLLWKESRGSNENLLNYIDTDTTRADKEYVAEYMKSGSCGVKLESIWDLNEANVLVVAEPGMGKSTHMTHLAYHTKLADPTSWVVHINWNEHSKELNKIHVESCSFETVLEFLCSVAFPGSKYYDLNRVMLKHALELTGNVTVLTDGYDEINPTHADKAAIILSVLRKTVVGRVWVTSRPVVRERLEKELSVMAYTMRPLSHTVQEEMLLNLWKSKATGHKDEKRLDAFIKKLLSKANESIYDSSFTGFALYIKMIATAFEVNLDTSLKSGDFSLPEKMDLLYLYDRFVERKLHIYQTEKKRDDVTNASVQDDHELLTKMFLKNFEMSALIVILPSPVMTSLHDKTIEVKLKSFIRRVQAGKDKTGVVIQVVEGRPYFVHRTFAEYFTARWFSKYFELNRCVLEDILFDRSYSIVRDVFDRILVSGSELHSAVLNWDAESVEAALQKGCDVNAMDKGGRTALHLIASQGQVYKIEQITESLLRHGACLDMLDKVLQWNPLRYAEKSGSWFVVERLLEHNADLSDLVLIKQRVHDSEYIGPILYEAAGEDYLLLVKFLSSIGVNMNQQLTDVRVTALHVATASRRLRIIRWLVEQGADCNSRDNNGWTPLFHAANEGSLDVVRMLVEEGGAKLDRYDIVGRTALDWAINGAAGGKDSNFFRTQGEGRDVGMGVGAVVEYLRERGCKVSDIADGVVITHDTN